MPAAFMRLDPLRLALVALSMLVAVAASPAARAADDFDIMGLYERISPPQASSDPTRVEIVEVFWYKCPHCYRFKPYMERFEASQPAYITVRHMPAVIADDWKVQARAYYAAESMQALERMHTRLFEAVHREGRSMDQPGQVRTLFVEQGIDGAAFDKHFRSFGVDARVRKAQQLTRAYGIAGVPALVINGRYRTSGALAGSFERALEVASALAEMERERLGIAAN